MQEKDITPLSAAIQESKYQAFHLMHDIGGGFASRLADAWFYADSTNRERIETAFADMLRKYVELGERYDAATVPTE